MSNTRHLSIEYRGREVTNPYARAAGTVGILLACVCLPFIAVLHPLMLVLGRRGFVTHEYDSATTTITISGAGFKKD